MRAELHVLVQIPGGIMKTADVFGVGADGFILIFLHFDRQHNQGLFFGSDLGVLYGNLLVDNFFLNLLHGFIPLL